MTTQVTLIGRMSEPKLNYTKSGTAILTFGLAVNKKVKEEEKTSWFDIKAWGELGENIVAKCGKGSRVIVTGYMEQEVFDDKDGNKRTKIVVVASDCGIALRFVNDQTD